MYVFEPGQGYCRPSSRFAKSVAWMDLQEAGTRSGDTTIRADYTMSPLPLDRWIKLCTCRTERKKVVGSDVGTKGFGVCFKSTSDSVSFGRVTFPPAQQSLKIGCSFVEPWDIVHSSAVHHKTGTEHHKSQAYVAQYSTHPSYISLYDNSSIVLADRLTLSLLTFEENFVRMHDPFECMTETRERRPPAESHEHM